MQAILYTSNTGFTARYAALLGQHTGLPVYTLSQAKKTLPAHAEVIYLGWLMAGTVKGYKKAAGRYQVLAVCGVGMGKTGSQTDEVRSKNAVPAAVPVFVLQGGFERNKLRGVYRLMMELMVKTAGKALAAKDNRTAEEEDMLDMMLHGGNRVCAEHLQAVAAWYGTQG